MEGIVRNIGNKQVPKIPSLDEFDIVASHKSNILGFALTKDLLIQKHKEIYSYRLKVENLVYMKDVFFKKYHTLKIDKNFLEKYFEENNDNPFSLQLIFAVLEQNKNVNKETVITQFPPLELSKDPVKAKQRFQQLIDKATIGDQIFMFDRNSYVSKIIRETDFCPWSHVAMIYKDKIIQDMTTAGLIRYELSELDPLEYDLALYRVNQELDHNLVIKRMDSSMGRFSYNWMGVARAYLYRKYKFLRFLQVKGDLTPADMIFSNTLRLIAYA